MASESAHGGRAFEQGRAGGGVIRIKRRHGPAGLTLAIDNRAGIGRKMHLAQHVL